MTEQEYGQALAVQAKQDLYDLISAHRIPSWWPDGGDLPRDQIRALTIIADEGHIEWADSRPNTYTIRQLGMVHKSNASALIRSMRDNGLVYGIGDTIHMTIKGWLMLDTFEEDNGQLDFHTNIPQIEHNIGGLFTSGE